MTHLRKHPILASIVIWAFLLSTAIVGLLLFRPDLINTMGAPGASVLVAVLGIPSTVMGYAAKVLGKSE